MRTKAIAMAVALGIVTGCASNTPQIIVDPNSITDSQQYEADVRECELIASTVNDGGAAVKNGAVAAVGAAGATAGVATAVAGAVFAPAIPFIAGAALLGGGYAGTDAQAKENEVKQRVINTCLRDRGYKVY